MTVCVYIGWIGKDEIHHEAEAFVEDQPNIASTFDDKEANALTSAVDKIIDLWNYKLQITHSNKLHEIHKHKEIHKADALFSDSLKGIFFNYCTQTSS